MAVTKSEKSLLLLLLYFPTPILMLNHEICQCWVLTTKDGHINTERRGVLGKYWRVPDSNETAQEIYHRKKFENEEGFTLWYDTTNQWAVYKNIFTDPPKTQQDTFIQTRCEEEVLDECKAFNYTYWRNGYGDVEDSSMSLTCIDNYCVDTAGDHECKTFVDKSLCGAEYAKQHCRKSCGHCKNKDFGSGTQEGSSLMSIGVGWLIVIVILMCVIIVSVMVMVILAVFFPKRSNLTKDYPNKNKSIEEQMALNRMNETTEMEDLQHQHCELEKKYLEATRMGTDANRKALSLALQFRQLSETVQAINVEDGLLPNTVPHVENETQVLEAQPIKLAKT